MSRARRMCVISSCTRGALDTWSRGPLNVDVRQLTNVLQLFHYALVTAFSGGAVYCFGWGLVRLLRENPELGWRRVPGQIISSTIEDSGKSTSAKILYAYKVDGDHFEGKRIAPIEVWASYSDSAANFVRKYPSGREVTVYVHPTRHSRAVLEPQQQPIAAVCVFLIGLILSGFAWLWWMSTLSPTA